MSAATQLTCPINRAVAAIADKWKILIIIALQDRTLRFSELARELDGIAPKVMSRQLRSLEADGLVTRSAYAEVPPRVEYALTVAGAGLLPIFNALQRWVVANRDSLASAIAGADPGKYGDVMPARDTIDGTPQRRDFGPQIVRRRQP